MRMCRWLQLLQWVAYQYRQRAAKHRLPTSEQLVSTQQMPGNPSYSHTGPLAVIGSCLDAGADGGYQPAVSEAGRDNATTRLTLPVSFPVGWGLPLVGAFQDCLAEFVSNWVRDLLPSLWNADRAPC